MSVWQQQNLNDDSFITLAYAKNLVKGNGFVYNHSPATLGTTTPFFAIIVALTSILIPSFTVIDTAIIISVLAWIGTIWGVYFTLRHTGVDCLSAAIAAIVPVFMARTWIGFIGMEIWLFEFLLILSILLTLKQQFFWAGVTVGALFLTRGEGAIVGSILFSYLFIQTRRVPTTFIAGGLVVVTAWSMYAISVFGTIIPNTLAAKQAQAVLNEGQSFYERILFDLLPRHLDNYNITGISWLNPYLWLIVLGLIYSISQKRITLLFVFWVLAYLIGYTILNPSPYYWYVLHIIFVLQLMAGLGVAGLIDLVQRYPTYKGFFATVTFIFIMLLLGPNVHYLLLEASHYVGDTRADNYKAVATWLNQHSSPDESVAYIEIGYLGYYTDNRIIDLAGLIDPVITDHLINDGFSWGFWHYQPDYYISTKDFDWALGEIKPLQEGYVMVYQTTTPLYESPIYIFKRQ